MVAKPVSSNGLPPAKLHHLDIPKTCALSWRSSVEMPEILGGHFHINQYTILALILQQSD